MSILVILLAIPVVSTLVGGMLAVRFRRHFSLLMALGAGLLLGAAFLDLLPEAILLGMQSAIAPANVLGLTLVAFLVFFAVANALDHLTSQRIAATPRKTAGRIAGAWLIFHSFRDGMVIGASYIAAHSAGYAVAIGIAAHDLGDGMNTVILTTSGEEPEIIDYLFLAGDAVAPLLGGLAAAWWLSSLKDSVVLLALAAGFFLQMGASDFLPEVRHSKGPRRYLIPAVVLGAGAIYLLNFVLATFHHSARGLAKHEKPMSAAEHVMQPGVVAHEQIETVSHAQDAHMPYRNNS